MDIENGAVFDSADNMPPSTDYMTIDKAAEELKVTRGSVYRAIKDEKIRCVKWMGKTAVLKSDVQSYKARPYKSKRKKEPPKTDVVKRPRGRPRKPTQTGTE